MTSTITIGHLIAYLYRFTDYFDYEKYLYYDYPLNHLADIFYVLNSAVNFIIYFLMGTSFRSQFLKLGKSICGRHFGFHFLSQSQPSLSDNQDSTKQLGQV